MNKKYFQPVAGQIYLNRYGTKYLCLEVKDASSALFISMSSGWTLIAHECSLKDDGTIEWNWSAGRGVNKVKETIEKYGFDVVALL